MTATTRLEFLLLVSLGEREGFHPDKFSVKGKIMNVGDSVVWIQVKSYGNKRELSKREGIITDISGDKATVTLTGYASSTSVVAISDLKLKSQDTPMSILEFAVSRFGASAQ
jgi:hypothetical protein